MGRRFDWMVLSPNVVRDEVHVHALMTINIFTNTNANLVLRTLSFILSQFT